MINTPGSCDFRCWSPTRPVSAEPGQYRFTSSITTANCTQSLRSHASSCTLGSRGRFSHCCRVSSAAGRNTSACLSVLRLGSSRMMSWQIGSTFFNSASGRTRTVDDGKLLTGVKMMTMLLQTLTLTPLTLPLSGAVI